MKSRSTERVTALGTIIERIGRKEKRIGLLRSRVLKNRRGSILVEATLVLPPFILGMILLISILPAIASVEGAVFSTCDELIKADARAAVISEPISAPIAVVSRIKRENPAIDAVMVTGYSYRHEGGNMNDLISLNLLLSAGGMNPLGRISSMHFEIGIRSRAITGRRRPNTGDESQFNRGEIYKRVYVFPRSGEKYHNGGCPFINPDCYMVYLTEGVKGNHTPCPNCHSERAALGTPVFCFWGEGTDYHFGSCNAVTKFYIEMDEMDAIDKGYGPCMSCGG